MGDRANIIIVDEENPELYFYTHWQGYALPKILQNGLIRGKSRWGDSQYLARILFCEMIQDEVLECTGFGLSTRLGDNEHDFLVVDMKAETDSIRDYNLKKRSKPLEAKILRSHSFDEYCKLEFKDDEDPWATVRKWEK